MGSPGRGSRSPEAGLGRGLRGCRLGLGGGARRWLLAEARICGTRNGCLETRTDPEVSGFAPLPAPGPPAGGPLRVALRLRGPSRGIRGIWGQIEPPSPWGRPRALPGSDSCSGPRPPAAMDLAQMCGACADRGFATIPGRELRVGGGGIRCLGPERGGPAGRTAGQGRGFEPLPCSAPLTAGRRGHTVPRGSPAAKPGPWDPLTPQHGPWAWTWASRPAAAPGGVLSALRSSREGAWRTAWLLEERQGQRERRGLHRGVFLRRWGALAGS